MTYRRNPITGDPVIFAPERAARPNAFRDTVDGEICPFCPGNEGETPPEVARVGPGSRGEEWTVRVVPNKYPATPHHEVIIESPRHDEMFPDIADPVPVVSTYRDRYAAMISGEEVRHACLFKNHGPEAGASVSHEHSQLIGIPFQPPRVEREAKSFARAARCPLCAAIAQHRQQGLMADETDSFVRFAPHGSSFAYQQWIVPTRHQSEITTLNEPEVKDLAAMLKRASAATLRIAPSMNWIFMNFAGEAAAHFYVDLFPRMTTVAGFELGTGTWIDIVDPADVVQKVKA